MVFPRSGWDNLSDSDGDNSKLVEAEKEDLNWPKGEQRPAASVVKEEPREQEESEEEDWEAEINLLNGPYEPGDVVRRNAKLKVPFHVPDHKVWEVKYLPAVHHVPPVCIDQPPEASIEGDQFEDAED